ncbi:MAG TPA: GNAT family N-acetyltransferase [Cyclobacteriaceae bacterium]|nr:GNAT family N-acetyltransferase [Cyclobacteriaceae bacterium]
MLERLKHSDAEQIFNNYASKPVPTKYMVWPTHRTLDDTRGFLDYAVKAWDDGVEYSYAIRKGVGQPVMGTWGVRDHNGKLEFGYILADEHWGKGYMTEICKTMMDLLRVMPGVYRIGAFLDAENVGSAKVLERAGLVEEARLAKWHRFPNQGNVPKDCILYNLVF